MGEMDGKVAVITGAGTGMGKACAQLFAREGAKVVAADISGKEKDTAAEFGSSVVPAHCDVSAEEDVIALFETAIHEFGRVDTVLNVAGIASGGRLADVPEETYDRILSIDLKGVFWGIKHGVRAMRETGGGSIVNWASVAAMASTSPMSSVYSTAKGGVISLTRSAAAEHGPEGIRVNAISPGTIMTDMVLNALKAAGRTVADAPGKPPLGRPGEAEEVAQLALFLASDRASYITGTNIPVDGGWTAVLAR
ncbi:SDR family NAD(P)-dependent oxidoreductase [Streptomyces sp. NPDC000941]